MENELQQKINTLENELTILEIQRAEYLKIIDDECNKLALHYGDFVSWENLQKVNMIKENNSYTATFINDVELKEIPITDVLFDAWGLYVTNIMTYGKLRQNLVELEKKLQKIFDDRDNTIFAVDKELKELQVINDNSIYRYSLMGVNNSLPRYMTLLNEHGETIPNDTTPLKINEHGVADIKVGKKCYCLDLSNFDFLGNYSSFYDNMFQNLNTPTIFSSKKRKEFMRYVLLFSGGHIDLTNKTEEELYKESREYAKTHFNTNVRKLWDYLNDLLLKKCKNISIKEDGTFKDIINNQVVRLSYKRIAQVLGMKYNRDTDGVLKNRIKNTVNFLGDCRLQLIQWQELSSLKRKEIQTKLKNKEKLSSNDLQECFKSGFNIPETKFNSKVTVNGFISIFNSLFKAENEKGNGFFRLEFNHLYVNFLIRQNTFKLPKTLFEIDAKCPSAYTLGKALSSLLYSSNSSPELRHNKDITELEYIGNYPKVNTLLQYTCIPNAEQAKETYGEDVNYRRYIITPFLNSLEVLHNICNLEYSFYNSKKNKEYLREERANIEKLSIKTFLDLQLKFKFLPLEKELEK